MAVQVPFSYVISVPKRQAVHVPVLMCDLTPRFSSNVRSQANSALNISEKGLTVKICRSHVLQEGRNQVWLVTPPKLPAVMVEV